MYFDDFGYQNRIEIFYEYIYYQLKYYIHFEGVILNNEHIFDIISIYSGDSG